MTWNNIFDVLTIFIGLGALIVSIIAIVSTKRSEKRRKLKDTIIGELIKFESNISLYLDPILTQKMTYSGQETISWFKFTMMKLEAILQFIKTNTNYNGEKDNDLKQNIQNLRQLINEDQEFMKACSNNEKYCLLNTTLLEINKEYTSFYTNILLLIGTINALQK
jgi:hypothetical protein